MDGDIENMSSFTAINLDAFLKLLWGRVWKLQSQVQNTSSGCFRSNIKSNIT